MIGDDSNYIDYNTYFLEKISVWLLESIPYGSNNRGPYNIWMDVLPLDSYDWISTQYIVSFIFPLLYSSPSVWLLRKKHRKMPHCRAKCVGTTRFSRARALNVACVERWFQIRSSWTIKGSVSIAKSANGIKLTDHNTSNFASHCRHPKIGGKNVLTVLAIATKISSVTSGSITKCP